MTGYLALHDAVVKKGLCTLCGSCAGICPSNAVMMTRDGPRLTGACTGCGRCFNVCPGKGIDIRDFSTRFLGGAGTEELGHFKNVYCAQSNMAEVRRRGSSGGVVTSLLTHLLKEKIVDGVATVTQDEANPMKITPTIITSEEGALRAAGSKYIRVPVNECASRLRSFDKLAFVCLPCQIHGLRKMQDFYDEYREKIYCIIGLFCGFNLLDAGTTFLVNKLGFRGKDLSHFSYREGKPPGGFYLRDKNGREGSIDKHAYTILNIMYSPWRCNLCNDFSAELADISVGDCWERSSDLGSWARVITRTERGEQIVKAAAERKIVTLLNDSPESILKTQSGLIRYKKRWLKSRAAVMGILGMRVHYGHLPAATPGEHAKSLSSFLIVAMCHTPLVRGVARVMPIGSMKKLSRWLRKKIHEKGSTLRPAA